MNTKFIFPELLRDVCIHFVGIKGTGMAALAEICNSRGANITGSDVEDTFYTDEVLRKINISPKPFDSSNIHSDIQFVVHSAAYKTDLHPELLKAIELGIPVVKYTDALGALSSTVNSCGVAGVHGKTTVTALCGSLVQALEFPAQVLVGSAVASFGGSCTLNNGHEYFIAETCEYERNFLSFSPRRIILTGVESDHQDYFPTYNDIRDAFVEYALLLPSKGQLIYCADDAGAVEVAQIVENQRSDIELVPYGKTAQSAYKVESTGIKDGYQTFTISQYAQNDFAIRIPGEHTILNCAAATALLCEIYKELHGTIPSFELLYKGFWNFCGTKRRSEIVGECNDILFIDDYAHHPTAIETTLAGLKEFYRGRKIIVDFMAHTYSRTAALFERFSAAFKSADEVILHEIYASARENNDGTVDGKKLYKAVSDLHKNVQYFEKPLDAMPYVLDRLEPTDIFVTMGAGDNWKLGNEVLSALQKKIGQTS